MSKGPLLSLAVATKKHLGDQGHPPLLAGPGDGEVGSLSEALGSRPMGLSPTWVLQDL